VRGSVSYQYVLMCEYLRCVRGTGWCFHMLTCGSMCWRCVGVPRAWACVCVRGHVFQVHWHGFQVRGHGFQRVDVQCVRMCLRRALIFECVGMRARAPLLQNQENTWKGSVGDTCVECRTSSFKSTYGAAVSNNAKKNLDEPISGIPPEMTSHAPHAHIPMTKGWV
jgi:hypothetical protein